MSPYSENALRCAIDWLLRLAVCAAIAAVIYYCRDGASKQRVHDAVERATKGKE